MSEYRPRPFALRGNLAVVCLALVAGCNAEVTPAPPGTNPHVLTEAPVVPAGLVATPGNGQVSLTWSATNGANSYEIKRSTTSGGPYTLLATATSASYVDATVTNGTNYYYVVTAINAQGVSSPSMQAPVTPAETPAAAPPTAPTPPVVITPPPAPAPPTPTFTPATSLPTVPALTNVRVAMNGSSATITFDSVDNAADYRVYTLPSNDNIQVGSDGSVIIPNAIYRCAGTYQVPAVEREDAWIANVGVGVRVASLVDGYTRTLSDAVLGHVYTTPDAAPDLIPVYVVGNPEVRADGYWFFRYSASRDKKYITSYSEYTNLLANGWRDDGIAFYVPSQATAATKPILANSPGPPDSRYYLTQGTEWNIRKTSLTFNTAFNVLSAPAAGTRPLMRVHYRVFGARSHDELAIGQADFTRLRYQGLSNAATTLHYSGIAGSTSLVVEALDKGCPFQGMVASKSRPAETIGSIPHQAWYTLGDLRSAAANGEVYVNGQHDGVSGRPKAIARAYLNVSPQARSTMDWMSTAASFSENLVESKCQSPDGNCFQEFHLQSNTYDFSFHYAETNRWQVGNVLGELLVNYADWAADTNGKFRMTVRDQKANITSNSFVHATMEVNAVGSARRYPQLILSDQNIPVQHNLVNGRSLILQTFGDFPARLDLEICDHVTWDVNLQCPRFVFRPKLNGAGAVTGLSPITEGDQFAAAADASTKLDLYTSNSRAYIFVNGKPYACANLTGTTGASPTPVPPSGPVTVTFGDVLYHSGADENFRTNMTGGFINRHQMISTSRHFDNLGFSSGVSAPTWNESGMPCTSRMGGDPDP